MTETAITRAELEWVLQRHGGRLDAAGLIDEIEANRDSIQYEPGAVYEDPEGNKWVFDRALGDDSPHWLRPGLAGSFEYATPRRPLRRLVPEGSPLSENERDLIHADLGKLLELLGLGDYARPESSHKVFLACLEEVAKLKASDVR
jgi:hypothetical protein